jgi:exodeoxyribonuclease III
MRITTWNVNSIRTRLPHITSWLDANQPDVLLLQETKVENALFPLDAFISRGYYVAAHGQKSYNGVAILSKTPLSEPTKGFKGQDMAEHARVLSATLQTASGPLRLINAYVVNGEDITSSKFTLKEQFYAALTAEVARQQAIYPRLLLAGDFNICADERDTDDPIKRAKNVLFTPQERQWLNTLCNHNTLHDALRLTTQDSGIFSWWDYRDGAFAKNRGLRIDYVFLSDALKDSLKTIHHDTAERTKPQPSDHIPVTVDLDV